MAITISNTSVCDAIFDQITLTSDVQSFALRVFVNKKYESINLLLLLQPVFVNPILILSLTTAMGCFLRMILSNTRMLKVYLTLKHKLITSFVVVLFIGFDTYREFEAWLEKKENN